MILLSTGPLKLSSDERFGLTVEPSFDYDAEVMEETPVAQLRHKKPSFDYDAAEMEETPAAQLHHTAALVANEPKSFALCQHNDLM